MSIRNFGLMIAGVAGLAMATPVLAHEQVVVGVQSGGWSGNVFAVSGSRHGGGVSGSIAYNSGYVPAYAVVPAHYPHARYYEACGHYHPRGYRSGRHGDSYHGSKHGHKHGKKHRNKHARYHRRDHYRHHGH